MSNCIGAPAKTKARRGKTESRSRGDLWYYGAREIPQAANRVVGRVRHPLPAARRAMGAEFLGERHDDRRY